MKKSVKRLAIAVTAVVGVGAVASIASTYDDEVATEAARPELTRNAEADETDDLDSIKLDNRSSQWVDDIWLTWEITNQSAEKSDYSFEWEAVNTITDKRIDFGYQFANKVAPGQTVKDETFTRLETDANIKINILDFERTKSW